MLAIMDAMPSTYTASRGNRSESQPPPVFPMMLDPPTTLTTDAATIGVA